jgi:hypothetical protein
MNIKKASQRRGEEQGEGWMGGGEARSGERN